VSKAELTLVGPINKGGRPPLDDFDQEVADQICLLLERGLSLTIICAHKDMPDLHKVYRWIRRNEQFCADYARARQLQANTFADQIQDIADNPFIPPAMKAQMIDARKWRAARQNWRAWGDKQVHETGIWICGRAAITNRRSSPSR
jgi:hypothetical protein